MSIIEFINYSNKITYVRKYGEDFHRLKPELNNLFNYAKLAIRYKIGMIIYNRKSYKSLLEL